MYLASDVRFGKSAFPKIINGPICHIAAIFKDFFPKFFWKINGQICGFYGRKPYKYFHLSIPVNTNIGKTSFVVVMNH